MNEKKWLHSVGLVIPTWCDSCELHYRCVRRKAIYRFIPKQFTSMIVNIGTQRVIFENWRRLQDVDAYSLNVWHLCPPLPLTSKLYTHIYFPPPNSMDLFRIFYLHVTTPTPLPPPLLSISVANSPTFLLYTSITSTGVYNRVFYESSCSLRIK